MSVFYFLNTNNLGYNRSYTILKVLSLHIDKLPHLRSLHGRNMNCGWSYNPNSS
jgi:hypothetical protein